MLRLLRLVLVSTVIINLPYFLNAARFFCQFLLVYNSRAAATYTSHGYYLRAAFIFLRASDCVTTVQRLSEGGNYLPGKQGMVIAPTTDESVVM